ncbi:unnamed protein product [Cylicocyclus nassatus]|uniref:Uncharacterized protein n=1 Tax=Cylicocyclus nassatus TaxID=53992 RepID=A0AA36M3U6_CYLNA|nr:unnamed protein product [Cylicocyclus nassatus]
MKNINWKIQCVEQRLRMQEPNIHLIEEMAKKLDVTYDDLAQDSKKILSSIWGQDSKNAQI